jgi:SAM-dependent methyltransferase
MNDQESGVAESHSWNSWEESEVVDAMTSAFVVRNYIEQSEVRRYVSRAGKATTLNSVADLGAGYGRMAMVLQEACEHVIAVEREPTFVERGRQLLPSIDFRQVWTLERVPIETDAVDFVLTFTVLQHLTDTALVGVVREITRIVPQGGFVLLCEETDGAYVDGDPANPDCHFTIGRTVQHYQAMMETFELVETSPRRLEPGYSRSNVGTYMLYRRKQ